MRPLVRSIARSSCRRRVEAHTRKALEVGRVQRPERRLMAHRGGGNDEIRLEVLASARRNGRGVPPSPTPPLSLAGPRQWAEALPEAGAPPWSVARGAIRTGRSPRLPACT